MKKYKNLMVAGTFDNFHVGHQFLLWSAYQIAEELVIIVARDETVEKIKSKNPRNFEHKRKERVELEFMNNKNVQVRLGREDMNFIKTIKEINPDVIYLGYDQRINTQELKQEFPKIKLIRAKSYNPDLFKSSFF